MKSTIYFIAATCLIAIGCSSHVVKHGTTPPAPVSGRARLTITSTDTVQVNGVSVYVERFSNGGGGVGALADRQYARNYYLHPRLRL